MVIVIFAVRFYVNSATSVKQLFFESFNTRSETQNAIKLSKWLVGEVERIRVAEHLWNDYIWVLKKLGFAKVAIFNAGENRIYEYPGIKIEDNFITIRMSLDKQNKDSYIQFCLISKSIIYIHFVKEITQFQMKNYCFIHKYFR